MGRAGTRHGVLHTLWLEIAVSHATDHTLYTPYYPSWVITGVISLERCVTYFVRCVYAVIITCDLSSSFLRDEPGILHEIKSAAKCSSDLFSFGTDLSPIL